MPEPTTSSRPEASTAPGPVTHVLYLHGFRSSPLSAKAQRMARAVAALAQPPRWWCPQLPPSPRDAMALVSRGIAGWPRDARLGVVGSSLGGFYATWVAEALAPGARVVLLNPAVEPARDLAAHIGTQHTWQAPGETFEFTPTHVAELRALQVGVLGQPARYLAVMATGDEVLSFAEMSTRYANARQRVIQGSDHAISDFDDHLDAVLAHLGLTASGA